MIIDKSGGKKFQVTISQTNYDVKKLIRNTNYTICVQAENIVGKSNKTCAVIQTLNKGNLFKGELKPEISFLHMEVLTLIKAKSNVST